MEYDKPDDPTKEMYNLICNMIKNGDYKRDKYLHGMLNGVILCWAMNGGTGGKDPIFVQQPDHKYYTEILEEFESDQIH